MEGKMPREMILDWLKKENKMDYSQLKKKAEDRTNWCWWTRTCHSQNIEERETRITSSFVALGETWQQSKMVFKIVWASLVYFAARTWVKLRHCADSRRNRISWTDSAAIRQKSIKTGSLDFICLTQSFFTTLTPYAHPGLIQMPYVSLDDEKCHIL